MPRSSPGSRRRCRISINCWQGTVWQHYNDCWWRYVMHDVLDELYRRVTAGETVGVGTVVATFSSAPRAPGAAMLVAPDGSVTGSVSGGCVEGAVYELAGQVVEDGTPVLQRFGVSDDDACAVGLTCGGIIDVYVEYVNAETMPELGDVVRSVHEGRPVAIATVVQHDEDPALLGKRMLIWPDQVSGELGSQRIDHSVTDDARGLLANGRSGVLYYGPDGQRRGEGMAVFVNSFEPRPRMLVFGA